VIASADRTVMVSSMGWVEHDALWVLRATDGKPETASCESGARWLSLHPGNDPFFAVAHHFGADRFEVTVRCFEAPFQAEARASLSAAGAAFSGDLTLWRQVPRLYVEYTRLEPWASHVLLSIDAERESIDVQQFAWFDDSYDHGYQGIVGVQEIPNAAFAIVSVQRSGRLVMHDLATGESCGTIDLGGTGNPDLLLRLDAGELWATDYDRLVVVDTATWRVTRSRRVQEEPFGSFIGRFAFTRDGTACAVARPFSGDVAVLNPSTLATLCVAELGSQPLDVTVLADGRIVARDWKTGGLLTGRPR
jgi:hypothetical protein